MIQDSTIKVFCYGSNMSSKRIKSEVRCPLAVFYCVASLKGYKFVFNKISVDRSSKANLLKTANNLDIVWGVVYSIPIHQKSVLDRAEGKGSGYDEFSILVDESKKNKLNCQCYIAVKEQVIDNSLQPYDWYIEHCIYGAKEYKLPDSYIKSLSTISYKIDSDPTRSKKERSIYYD